MFKRTSGWLPVKSAHVSSVGPPTLQLSPGVDVNVDRWTLHAEIDIPVYQNVIGNQLVAPQMFKTNVAYSF